MATLYRRYVGRKIVAQLPDLTLAGTLEREDATTLLLVDVVAIGSDGREKKPVDGEVVIERAHLQWAQVV